MYLCPKFLNFSVLFFKHKITNFRELLFYYRKKFKQLLIEKKGYINLKEGKSWFRENREMKFGFYFTEEKGYKYYSIMVPGKEGEVSIPKKGEPKAYTNLHLLIDGETGQVYTEEEWKAFEQEPWGKK